MKYRERTQDLPVIAHRRALFSSFELAVGDTVQRDFGRASPPLRANANLLSGFLTPLDLPRSDRLSKIIDLPGCA